MSDSEDETVHVELAEWAKIQQKTFTRWTYQQLKVRDIPFESLQFGFKDGVNLINLVELLTQHAARRYNKTPKIKMQMVENIGIALKILTEDGIKLVNIGNEDIYAGNMKLILGLVWTLILHYQISVDFGGEDNGGGKSDVSAKKQLMDWASNLVNNLPNLPSDPKNSEPGRPIKNFTTDWNDGVALCSMVEAVAPGLCPEYSSLDPEKRLENAKLGLDRAEQGLGVPKIIEAEDLINPNIDELSVLTYVSLLKNATPKIDLKPVDPLKIKIYGPGTETAWVNTPTQFFIDTSNAGFGKLQVEILDKDGNKVPVELWKKDTETKVQYTPTTTGNHKFSVTYNTVPVPQGTFTVRVLAPSDASKLQLSGDGLKKAYVGKLSYFICDKAEAGEGDLDVTVVGPTGKIPVDIEPLDDLKIKVCYTPIKAGPTLVTIKYSGSEIPESPLHVEVVDDIDPLKVKILNKGLDAVVSNTPVKFVVCTAGAGNGDLKVSVVDEDGHPLKVTIGDIDEDNKQVLFTPDQPGQHRVTVTWSGQPVPDGNIHLDVAKPLDLTACIVTDLSNPVVGQPTHFTVDLSKVGSEELGVNVIDSKGEPLQVTIASIGDGQYQATYTALNAGPHKVNVKIEDKHVPGSAFTVYGIDPLKVIVNFDNNKEYKVGEAVEVPLNMTEAGPGQLGIQLSAPPDSGADCHAKEISPGSMVVVFTPSAPGEHVLNLTFDDHNVPACPVLIKVIPKANVGAVLCDGDGLRSGQVGTTAVFTVDISEAGTGDLGVFVSGPKEEVPVTRIEIGDGKYEIGYTPKEEGSYVISVKFANQHVPGSAFRPVVTKCTNPNDVVAYGKGLEEDSIMMTTDTPSDDFVVLSDTKSKLESLKAEPHMSFSLVGDISSASDQISIDPSTVLPDEDASTEDSISILSINEKEPEEEEKKKPVAAFDLFGEGGADFWTEETDEEEEEEEAAAVDVKPAIDLFGEGAAVEVKPAIDLFGEGGADFWTEETDEESDEEESLKPETTQSEEPNISFSLVDVSVHEEERPAAVEEKPAAVEEKPAAVEETPAAVEEKPAVVEEKPAAVEEKPAAGIDMFGEGAAEFWTEETDEEEEEDAAPDVAEDVVHASPDAELNAEVPAMPAMTAADIKQDIPTSTPETEPLPKVYTNMQGIPEHLKVKPELESSECTGSSGPDSSPEAVPEEEIVVEKAEVQEVGKPCNIYPIIHAICFTLVSVYLLIPVLHPDISLSEGSRVVGYSLQIYFLSATLIDVEFLSPGVFGEWTREVFNLMVLPMVLCHLGHTAYYPNIDTVLANVTQSGCIIFGILAVVEFILVRQHPEAKSVFDTARSIGLGVVGGLGTALLYQKFSKIGTPQSILGDGY